jgi:hypothetical protein
MKLKAFIPACYIAGILIAQAQLSGEVSLGGASSDQPQEEKQGNPQTKEITVTGLGENPQAAEKQAISDAVRQAVGAFIDANTLVENEEVVRILDSDGEMITTAKEISWQPFATSQQSLVMIGPYAKADSES